MDSPVEGLEYEIPTHTGITDSDGTFMYYESDIIRFYIGDIMLGEAMAISMMTPIDLVEGAIDERYPAVVNMARYLQIIDRDMNPENGITTTEAMSDAMVDHMIGFNMDPDQFEYDPEKYLKPKLAKKKGWFGRYLDRMAKINEKEFGKDGPHCCH